MKEIIEKGKSISKSLSEIEESLYQTKNRSNQDPLNYPIRLTDKLSGVGSDAGVGQNRPTKQAYEVKKELTGKVDDQLTRYRKVMSEEVPDLNKMIKEKAVDLIKLKSKPEVN